MKKKTEDNEIRFAEVPLQTREDGFDHKSEEVPAVQLSGVPCVICHAGTEHYGKDSLRNYYRCTKCKHTWSVPHG
jgi:hypothetical protein